MKHVMPVLLCTLVTHGLAAAEPLDRTDGLMDD